MTERELDEFVEAVFAKVIEVDNERPQDWNTNDTITFGQWRTAIKETLRYFLRHVEVVQK